MSKSLEDIFEMLSWNLERQQRWRAMLNANWQNTTKLERHYHTTDHMVQIYSDHFQYDPNLEIDPLIVAQFAVWHDLVMVLEPGVSEMLSALSFAENIKSWIVLEAILATAHHIKDQPWVSPSGQWLLDLDLVGLASERDNFDRNTELIRAEYEPHVGSQKFIDGRCNFLEAMLARKNIFYFLADLEEPARANIQRELDVYKNKRT